MTTMNFFLFCPHSNAIRKATAKKTKLHYFMFIFSLIRFHVWIFTRNFRRSYQQSESIIWIRTKWLKFTKFKKKVSSFFYINLRLLNYEAGTACSDTYKTGVFIHVARNLLMSVIFKNGICREESCNKWHK
jgi:hypothetical protein